MNYLPVFILGVATLCQTCMSFGEIAIQRHGKRRAFSLRSELFSLPEESDFMASLRSRVDEVQDSSTKLPLVVLDSMLPLQVLKIEVKNPLLKILVAHRIENETPTFGMIGMARLSTGESVHLTNGVEVELKGMPEFLSEQEGGGVRLTLKGTRRFSIQGEIANAEQGWTEARVKFLNSEDEADAQIKGEDRMAVARAMMQARQLTNPNMNMPDQMSLVESWIKLAKENERSPGQIDTLLEELGDIPSAEEPTERAFWIGALINPIPAMGVALEVRPSLLMAETAEERIKVASAGILKSIRHMDGSDRLF